MRRDLALVSQSTEAKGDNEKTRFCSPLTTVSEAGLGRHLSVWLFGEGRRAPLAGAGS